MPRKFFDISGRTFGHWTVIGPRKSRRGLTLWPCRCECGREQNVNSWLLRSGRSRGCRRCSGRHKFVDLSGRTFGSWTVLRHVGTKNRNSYFACRCDCGVEKDVSGGNLVTGQSQGCFKCRHSGDRNGARQKALRANGGRPVLCGTREYTQAASCKDRATKMGLEFGFSTLSECAEWIKKNTPSVCPVLKIPLVPSRDRRSGFKRNMPSVDRKDSTRGYTPDNMQVMSMQANAMKNDATADELRLFAEWVLRGC